MEQFERISKEEMSEEKPPNLNKNPTPNLLRKSIFDTNNYHYYFTEVWNEEIEP